MKTKLSSKSKIPDWYAQIYEVVAAIPRGSVLTYGEVAWQANIASPRMVGQALHHNPDQSNIPCHRVVFADGSLSPAFAFGGQNVQRKLLEAEGIEFVGEKVAPKYLRK